MKGFIIVFIGVILYSLNQGTVYAQICPSPGVGTEVVIDGGFEAGGGPSTYGPHSLAVLGDCRSTFSNPGEYAITTTGACTGSGGFEDFNWGDYDTYGPFSAHGGSSVLMIDASTSDPATSWQQSGRPVFSGETYYFSAWIHALTNVELTTMRFEVVGNVTGTSILTTFMAQPFSSGWVQNYGTWNSGPNTSVTIRMVMDNPGGFGFSGNDYAIDDISFINSCQNVDAGPTPNFPAELSLCGTGVVDINSGIPSHSDHTFTWFRGAVDLSVNNPVLSNVTSTGTYTVCIDSAGCVNQSSVDVVANLNVDLGPDLNLCNPASATLSSGIPAPGTGYDIDWSRNGTPLVYADDQVNLFINQPGTYQVDVDGGGPGCTDSDIINVTTSAAAEPNNAVFCPTGQVNLSVTGGGSYEWYANSTGGVPLTSGSSYSPTLSSGTTFYVQDNSVFSTPKFGEGPADPGSDHNACCIGANNYIVITANVDFTINALDIYVSSSSFTLQLQNATGTTTLQTRDYSGAPTASNQEYRATGVNFNLTAGTTYRLYSTAARVTPFGTVTQGTDYGDFSIDSWGVPSNWYPGYYDFDITVTTGNPCARVPVTAFEDCPLPVDWLYFDVSLNNSRTPILNWGTATEKNNCYFEVYRSIDGVDFEVISTIDGATNSDVVTNYEFVDTESPLNPILYYQVRQVDCDGNSSVSSIESVKLSDRLEVIFYPNPVNDQLFIEVYGEDDIQVRVFNELSQVVREVSGENGSAIINTSSLLPGFYFLTVYNKMGRLMLNDKIVKIR